MTVSVLAMLASGCDSHGIFDPDEKLPTLPGVSTELRIVHSDECGILLVEEVTNRSGRDIVVYFAPDFQAYRLVVTDAAGREVPLRQFGRERKAMGEDRRSHPRGSGLYNYRPQGGLPSSYEKEIPLSRLFDLSEPGIYTAELSTRFRVHDPKPGDPRFFATNPEPVTFEVKRPGGVTRVGPCDGIDVFKTTFSSPLVERSGGTP